MKIVGQVTALLLCLLSTTFTLAQQHAVHSIDVRNGLPSFNVNEVHVDRTGVIWIATQDGLCRWNGRSLQTFGPNLEDSTSVINQRCYQIFEDADGRLRFSAINGFAEFDRGRQAFRNWYPSGRRDGEPLKSSVVVAVNDSLVYSTNAQQVNKLFNLARNTRSQMRVARGRQSPIVEITGSPSPISDRRGAVWAITQYGLASLQPSDSVFRVMNASIRSTTTLPEFVMRTADGRVAWLLSWQTGALQILDLAQKGSASIVPLPPAFVQQPIAVFRPLRNDRCVLVTAGGTIWLVQRERSGQYEIRNVERPELRRADLTQCESGVLDAHGNLWWSGAGGVSSFDPMSGTYAFVSFVGRTALATPQSIIVPVHVDALGRITAQPPSGGVIVQDPMRPFARPIEGLHDQVVQTVGIDEDRTLAFFATGPADAALVNTRTQAVQYIGLGSQRVDVHGAYRARDGRVWVGSKGQVFAIWPQSGEVKRYALQMSNADVSDLSSTVLRFGEGRDGTLFAFTDHGRFMWDPNKSSFTHHAGTDNVLEFELQNAIVGIVPSTDGQTWIYGYKDVGVMSSNGSVSPLHLQPVNETMEKLAAIKYVSMMEGGKAVIVDRRGVAIADLTQRTFARVKSPFVDAGRQPYLGAKRDHRGILWIVATTHVECLDLRTLRYRLLPLEDDDGPLRIRSATFPSVGNTMKIWLEHARGTSVLDPHLVPAMRTDVAIELSALRVRDEIRPLEPWLNLRDSLMLGYEESPFTIAFTVIDPTYGQHLRYRYLLEGYDAHWIDASDVLEARYQNVGPGTYAFRVQIFDVDGTWKEPRRPLTVIITPAWWQTLWLKLGVAFAVGLVGMGFYRSRVRAITARNHALEEQVRERTRDLQAEQERSSGLLLNVLPSAVAERLKNGERQIADHYSNASVLFADLVGFTPLTAALTPIQIVTILNGLFSLFDRLAREHGVERIKTIGDGYMAATGVPAPAADHAVRIAAFAVDMLDAMEAYARESGYDLHIRIGINCGDVVAAVVGESRFAYDLWGDTVNVAARMEANGEADRIHCTQAFVDALASQAMGTFNIEEHGMIDVKGKGRMQTYWIKKKD
ncbi:MAG: hypothetical protein JSS89_05620 [Bacteroidetes bacterium]|nr:hypothetical protein [Bacteroidota bacterium]